jgi:microcystin-dependent protein
MRQRRPVHAGDGAGLDPVRLGERGGTDTAEITMQTLPPHTHASGLEDHSHTLPAHTHEASLLATLNAPDTNDPSGAAFATFPGGNIYGTGTLDLSLAAGSTSVTPTAVETRPDTGGAPRTQPAGDGNSSIPVVAPGLVLRFCMVTDGVYPALR